MDSSVIDQYEAGIDSVRQAIAGLSEEELRATPVPGKWSTHQVMIHLADGESAFSDRIRRILAHDDPVLLAWDENKFAQRLHYDVQSTIDAVEIIALNRRQVSRILRACGDDELGRSGQHSERGRQTLADVLGFAIWHLAHHLKFVEEKRKALGK